MASSMMLLPLEDLEPCFHFARFFFYAFMDAQSVICEEKIGKYRII
jgi:hypothetical protein